ncbi:MAG: type II 3-dehydroquinate dehydratase [Pseudomonadota bacterium]|nr:type II 3-dehydroquinate dehydratase [Pseudomonadota bacterium]
MLTILVANGVNLDLLGRREQEHYGSFTLQDLEDSLQLWAGKFSALLDIGKPKLVFLQSNDECTFLEKLSANWDGVLLNPGAWTHTSLALADRLQSLPHIPYVEVHISNIRKRRRRSYCADNALAVVCGAGMDSYLAGLYVLLKHLAHAD